MTKFIPKNNSTKNTEKNKVLDDITGHLQDKTKELQDENCRLSDEINKITHNLAESEQKKIILADLNTLLEKNLNMLKNTENNPDLLVSKDSTVRELMQQKDIMLGIDTIQEHKSNRYKKKYTSMLIISISLLLLTTTLIGLYSQPISNYKIIHDTSIASNYVIQNLKGDTIDTWVSWQIPTEKILYFNIVNNEHLTNERFEVIESVILSEEFFEIDDSWMNKGPSGNANVYYLGWFGALQYASNTSTKFPIPVNFEIISESSSNVGDIVINLTALSSGDGYSGYTRNIADGPQNQILKSEITIYDIKQLSDNKLKTILRHELGHTFGLAHTTAVEDLMSPEILTEYPYISPCDIDAIIQLYDGNKKSEVTCKI